MRHVLRRAVRVSGPWSFPLAALLWLRVVVELVRVVLVLGVAALAVHFLGWWPS